MGRIRNFFRRSIAEQTLLAEATVLLLISRIGLRTMPFVRLRTFLSLFARIRTRRGQRVRADNRIDRIVWAVETAGQQFPAIGTCLTEALTAHVLLARSGFRSDLRIGVSRDPNGKFLAHAWLENDGIVLIGGELGKDFTPMPVLNGLHL